LNSYKQIQAQIARLEREAEDARKTEAAAVVDKLKKSIALYGLTAADLGLGDAGRPTTRKRAAAKTAAKLAGRKTAGAKTTRSGAGVAKFRDPKSGATWSGFGRVPAWLASVKNREAFRIGKDATSPRTGAPAGAEPKPPAKALGKAGARAASKKAVAASSAATEKRPPAKKRIAAKNSAVAQSLASALEEPSLPTPPPVVALEGQPQEAPPAVSRPDETAAS
jgi:DNA-binding protein H-NS